MGADWTPEEYKKLRSKKTGDQWGQSPQVEAELASAGPNPTSVDWRTKGNVVTKVKNQANSLRSPRRLMSIASRIQILAVALVAARVLLLSLDTTHRRLLACRWSRTCHTRAQMEPVSHTRQLSRTLA